VLTGLALSERASVAAVTRSVSGLCSGAITTDDKCVSAAAQAGVTSVPRIRWVPLLAYHRPAA
jgi:hypothetical protein